MTTYARIQNNVAVEIFVPHNGFSIRDCFHSEVVALFTVVPDGTLAGSTLENGAWVAPPVQPDVAPAPKVYPALMPTQFYDALTPQEETAILGSTDPMVQTFARRLSRALQTNTPIDPNLATVQEGLAYLSVTDQVPAVTPAATYILPTRIPQILAGIAQ
jgi:hypothetical protein